MTHSYVVSVALPSVDNPDQQGLVTIITPSGALEVRHPDLNKLNLDDPEAYSLALIKVMYPGVKGKIHGATTVHREFTETSATLIIVRVDTDS